MFSSHEAIIHQIFINSADGDNHHHMHRQRVFFVLFFAPPVYGTGRKPAPAPSTLGGVLQEWQKFETNLIIDHASVLCNKVHLRVPVPCICMHLRVPVPVRLYLYGLTHHG
jgi:hypothetical protein